MKGRAMAHGAGKRGGMGHSAPGIVLAQGGYRSAPAKPTLRREVAPMSSSDSSDSSRKGRRDEEGRSYESCRRKGKCRYDVRSTDIANVPLADHLFLIRVDPCGNETFWRGGPENPRDEDSRCDGLDGERGAIDTTSGFYGPGTVDWDPEAESHTVRDDEEACNEAKLTCIDAEMRRIHASCTAYSALGPNSNSVVFTALRACGLPEEKPSGWHPGWEEVIP